MKSLIFISAALMAGAGIFGFVDYKKKEQSKEFKTLYKEEKPAVQQLTPEIVSSPAPIITVNATAEETVVKGKSTVRKKGKHKRIKYTEFSRAIPDPEYVQPEPPVKELQ